MDRDDTCCAHRALFKDAGFTRETRVRESNAARNTSEEGFASEANVEGGNDRAEFHGIHAPRSLEFPRLSFTEHEIPQCPRFLMSTFNGFIESPILSIFLFLLSPNLSVPTSVANPVSDVINVRCLMIVILKRWNDEEILSSALLESGFVFLTSATRVHTVSSIWSLHRQRFRKNRFA